MTYLIALHVVDDGCIYFFLYPVSGILSPPQTSPPTTTTPPTIQYNLPTILTLLGLLVLYLTLVFSLSTATAVLGVEGRYVSPFSPPSSSPEVHVYPQLDLDLDSDVHKREEGNGNGNGNRQEQKQTHVQDLEETTPTPTTPITVTVTVVEVLLATTTATATATVYR